MTILVTGGSGYIGSHTVFELLKANNDVLVLDNLSNSSYEPLHRIERLTGKNVDFVQGDICDIETLRALFKSHTIESVIHFAGLKAVGESVEKPHLYYQNNFSGSLNLIKVMAENDVKNIVFSSSATVYGAENKSPLHEDMPTGPTNPYGQSKLMVEHLLRDTAIADSSWNIACLRYFNPIGAIDSGELGEDPNGIPNNLVPYVAQVASGKLEKVQIFGNDYPTKDGTGLRDYIHVTDLAIGHVQAIEKIKTLSGFNAINLGTGLAYSVLDVIQHYKEVSKKEIAWEIVDRRKGDLPCVFADAHKAKELLGWEATRNLEIMIADSWNWQSNNPNGYKQMEASSNACNN